MDILIVYTCDNGCKCGCYSDKWEEVQIYKLNLNQDVKSFIEEEKKDITVWYKKWKHGRCNIKEAYIIQNKIDLKNKNNDTSIINEIVL